MPTIIDFGPRDWARCRFGSSLLWETVQAVRTLTDPTGQQYHRAWLETIDQPSARRHLPGLLALSPPRGWSPDFICPAPVAVDRGFEAELAEVAAYPLEHVARDIARSLNSAPTGRRATVLAPMVADPAVALDRLLDELRYAWTTLISPFWASVRDLIDADVAHRSGRLAAAGLGAVLDDLDRRVTWSRHGIEVERGEDVRIELAGRGLTLMPSAFAWPLVIVVHEPPWQPTLVYPARGIGELWSAPASVPSGLSAALGRAQTRLLDALDRPATTTALAARHGLSPAATSDQLQRLRAAGLIAGVRDGKQVRYRRTALGNQLVRANRA